MPNRKLNLLDRFMMGGHFVLVCSFYVLITVAMAIWETVHHGAFELTTWVFPVTGIAFSFYAYAQFSKATVVVEKMSAVLRSSREGQLNLRVTHTAGLGEIGMAAWELNDFLDMIENYFKEVNTCFKLVAEGSYHRRAYTEGLPGQFAVSLGKINLASRQWRRTAHTSAKTNWLRGFTRSMPANCWATSR